MFRRMRKLIAGILIGTGVRYFINKISSIRCLDFYNWNWLNYMWHKLLI